MQAVGVSATTSSRSSNALARLCLQLGESLAAPWNGTVESAASTRAADRFLSLVRHHSMSGCEVEAAAALAYRLFDCGDESDRLGCWLLIVEVIRRGVDEPALHKLVHRATSWLPQLIRLRWHRAPGVAAHDASVPTSARDAIVDGAVFPAAYDAVKRAVRQFFTHERVAFLDLAWNWVAANRGTAKPEADDVELFRDIAGCSELLWKLRRRNPRPTSCRYIQDIFAEVIGDPTAGVHPTLRQWSQRLSSDPHCVNCDTWKHDALGCPCSAQQVEDATVLPRSATTARITELVGGPLLENGKGPTVEETRRSQVLALMDLAAAAVVKGEPVAEYFLLIDSVRQNKMTAAQRSALFILSSYSVAPSAVCLNRQAVLAKAKPHFDMFRRQMELLQLTRAMSAACEVGRQGGQLSDAQMNALHQIKTRKEFLFCYFGKSDGNPRVAPELEAFQATYGDPALLTAKDSILPIAVETLAPVIDYICPKTMQPLDEAAPPPQHRRGGPNVDPHHMTEYWDHYVGRTVLEHHQLAGIRWPDDEYKVQEVYNSYADDSDEKKSLATAIKVLLQRKVPYCSRCRTYGHPPKKCYAGAKKTLSRQNFSAFDCRLRPWLVRNRIELLEADARNPRPEDDAEALEKDAKFLTEALEAVIARKGSFPEVFGRAIEALEAAHVDLAAARHLPDVTERCILGLGRYDLLTPLKYVSHAGFPNVSLIRSSAYELAEQEEDPDAPVRHLLNYIAAMSPPVTLQDLFERSAHASRALASLEAEPSVVALESHQWKVAKARLDSLHKLTVKRMESARTSLLFAGNAAAPTTAAVAEPRRLAAPATLRMSQLVDGSDKDERSDTSTGRSRGRSASRRSSSSARTARSGSRRSVASRKGGSNARRSRSSRSRSPRSRSPRSSLRSDSRRGRSYRSRSASSRSRQRSRSSRKRSREGSSGR